MPLIFSVGKSVFMTLLLGKRELEFEAWLTHFIIKFTLFIIIFFILRHGLAVSPKL